jgi:hypothetical protein
MVPGVRSSGDLAVCLAVIDVADRWQGAVLAQGLPVTLPLIKAASLAPLMVMVTTLQAVPTGILRIAYSDQGGRKMWTSRSKYWAQLSLLVFSLIALATNSAAPQNPPPPAAVLTQRYDNGRTGANLQEYLLTVAAVSSGEFQKLYTIPVNGQVYAQPLLVPQVRWTDGTIKNVLIVATTQNWVHAFQVDDPLHKDAINGGAFTPISLWSSNLGNAVPANFMPMSYSSWTCVLGNCWPNASVPTVLRPYHRLAASRLRPPHLAVYIISIHQSAL